MSHSYNAGISVLGFGSLAKCFYVFVFRYGVREAPLSIWREDNQWNIDVIPLRVKKKPLDARGKPCYGVRI